MEFRQPSHPQDAKDYTTSRLRDEYLIGGLFEAGKVKRVYSHFDRIIIMGFCPDKKPIEIGETLDIFKNIGTSFFLERRELGVINVGGIGTVTVDGKAYVLAPLDGLYVGKGAKEVLFKSDEPENPAKFYALSTPAHCTYPNYYIDKETAKKVDAGDAQNANRRMIHQYIHPDVLKSCQLSMGLTELEVGSVWNTMPCHTHERRMEVYFYFGIKGNNVVCHFMGEPQETRHIIVKNEEAVISPSWSIHSGSGTGCYKFIWGMAGENQTFDDMDHIDLKGLK